MEEVFHVLNYCRMIKTEEELFLYRYTNKISCEAHKFVMRSVKPGMSEYQMEALFKFACLNLNGKDEVAYGCICASGDDAATLHYNLFKYKR